MVFAHLPAGYLLTKHLQKRLNISALLWVGLLGSIFPDFDILYFYLVDEQQVSHRQYWTHLPLFWLIIACLVFTVVWRLGNRKTKYICIFFFANIGLHLCLDTVMAPMYWLRPFVDGSFQLLILSIEKHFDFWLWNYVLHPAFIFELSICAVAGAFWVFKESGFLKPHPY